LKFSTHFCKNSTNKLQWEVLKINPENDRKFCVEVDIPVTRILVYINYVLSDFYYQITFHVLPSLATLTHSATQEIFLLQTQLVDEQPILTGTVP
jgi:hypothetical protein